MLTNKQESDFPALNFCIVRFFSSLSCRILVTRLAGLTEKSSVRPAILCCTQGWTVLETFATNQK